MVELMHCMNVLLLGPGTSEGGIRWLGGEGGPARGGGSCDPQDPPLDLPLGSSRNMLAINSQAFFPLQAITVKLYMMAKKHPKFCTQIYEWLNCLCTKF